MILRLRRPATFLPTLLGIASLAVPERAGAQASTVSLRWSAPAGCPSSESVRERVLSLVGRGATLEADAAVTKSGGEYQVVVHVQVADTVGERPLHAPTCAALAESVAVVLALAGTAPPKPPPPPPSPPEIPPAPTPPPAPPPPIIAATAPAPVASSSRARAKGPSKPSRVRIAAFGSLDVGTLPVVTYGGELEVAITPGRGVAFGLAADLWANQDGVLSSNSTQGAHFSLFSADAFGCLSVVRVGAVDLSPCALVDVARMVSSSFNAGQNSSATAVWVSLGAGGRARWELGRTFALALDLEALVPTAQQQFSISGTSGGTIHTVSPVLGRAHFGPEVRF